MREVLGSLPLLAGMLGQSSGGGVFLAAWKTAAALHPESPLDVAGQ